MFPQIPSDLSGLSAAELEALLAECQTAYAAARPEATTPEAVAALVEFATAVETVRAAHATALSAQADLEAQLAAADAAFSTTPPAPEGGDSGEGAEGGDGADPDADAENGEGGDGADAELSVEDVRNLVNEAVAAAVSALPAQPRRRTPVVASIADMNARRPESAAPVAQAEPTPFTITAAADIPGFSTGQQLSTRREVAEALLRRSEALGHGRGGPDDKVPVVSFAIDRGEDRTLSGGDYNWANERKIRQVVEEREAVVAAGGLCAPVNSYYEQMIISQSWRPVFGGAIPTFTVDRGGLRFNPPPGLADITSGVGTITAAADLAGGVGAAKACFAVTCNAITEVDVEADYVCVEFGNFGARTFPENVEAWMELAAAAHARAAEGNRLTDIKNGSTAATSAGLTGAARELIARLSQAQAVINSAARRPADAPVEAILPQWVLALARADGVRTIGDGIQVLNDSEIGQMLADAHILATLTPDSATGNSQVIATEAGGVLNEFPSTIYAEVFIPGMFLGLDGGRLDLGLVRDSALTMGNAATTTPGNRFRMFYEDFEALAKVGPASGGAIEVALSLCADGTYGAAKSVTCPITT